MIGIYKITSRAGKVYIGQSWNIARRRRGYQSLDCKKQGKLFNSLSRHGWANHIFEVICELPSDVGQEVLDQYEVLYWNHYQSCGVELLNIKHPAIGGGKQSEETKQRISSSSIGKKLSKESIEKRTESRRYWKPSEEQVRAMILGKKAKSLSEETRQKLSENAKRRVYSEETRRKMSEAKKGKSGAKLGWRKNKS